LPWRGLLIGSKLTVDVMQNCILPRKNSLQSSFDDETQTLPQQLRKTRVGFKQAVWVRLFLWQSPSCQVMQWADCLKNRTGKKNSSAD
jgi:hypothetical protein